MQHARVDDTCTYCTTYLQSEDEAQAQQVTRCDVDDGGGEEEKAQKGKSMLERK